MKLLPLKSSLNHLWLCVFLSLLWVSIVCTTTSPPSITLTATPTSGKTAAPDPEIAVSKPFVAPLDVEDIRILGQNLTSITLLWTKVDGISNYLLVFNGTQTEIPYSEKNITHTATGLESGTKYNFTLFTVLNGTRSEGKSLPAVTAPGDVESFSADGQNDTSITLKWKKINNIDIYTLQFNERNENISANSETYTVSGLTSATRYTFTLFAVFEYATSSGAVLTAVTAPGDVEGFSADGQNDTSITLKWKKINNIDIYTLQFNERKENISANSETYTVSGLTSATTYTFSLFAVFEYATSSGAVLTAVTAPGDVEGFSADGQNDTSITLKWKKINNIDIYTLQFNERKENISANAETYTVSGLTSATTYTFSLFAMFEYATSSGAVLTAVTAPQNVKELKSRDQNETSVTVQWKKVDDINTYTLLINEREEHFTLSAENGTYTVNNLISATGYIFRLFAVFDYAKSSGVSITAVTAPRNVEEFKSLDQNETSVTLQWKDVNNISNYILLFDESKINVTTSAEMGTHTVYSLKSGAKHNFTLFTVFEYASSSGVSITAATVPPMMPSVDQTERSLTNVTLEWEIMNQDWGYQVQIHGNNASIESTSKTSHKASYLVSRLNPGTVYNFSVITNFGGLNSTAYTDFIVTTIDCASGKWQVTNSTIQGTIKGAFTKATVSNESHGVISTSTNVLFTGLCPGTTYGVSLHYERQSKSFQQCSHKVTILPSNLKGYCKYWGSGYAARIIWDPPNGVWTTVQVNVSGKTFDINGKEDHFILHELKPAKRYKVSLGLLSGTERSAEPFEFSCLTDDRGVIAGAFFAVVLFIALVCVAVLIYLKHPEKIRKQPAGGSKQQKSKAKAIPVTKFSYHFNQLSLDENRGFSEEYEGLSSVGTDQTCKAANLPENRPKNRFTNVLPYDWCRVKLITATPSETLDYINASYMPGYNSNREYIATQGPLPSTVKDFWRMVWEQRVNCIVMVTNCTEGGRTKCEQYWARDCKECLYGELLVTVQSEQVESSWTLRQLTVKHNDTSEERTVKHFHFTVWPDHGVPQDTGVLIQFRQLVREHIETDGGQAPTVVHCSAGVGRTGTIIALDVLLQQLEKEQAVGINAFVHKMRLNRPYMVQTESQYVFLHQCIVDTLQPHQKTDENVYENSDVIYVNATALRELR
ncbi:receptor-type tyrosine-protein phosphatase H-like isoform 2-T2 [Menidia menidia]